MKRVETVVLIGVAVFGAVYAGKVPVEMSRVEQSKLALGAIHAESGPEPITREEKNKLLVRVAIGAMNAGDFEEMAELYSPRFVQHSPGSFKPTTWTDFELGCRIMKSKFPTLRIEIEDIIAEGNKVAVRLKTVVKFKESHNPSIRGPGKVEFREIDIMRIEGGRIIEEWCEYDTEAMKQKLRKLQYIKTWQ